MFKSPYGAPEHRSRDLEKRASCLSPRRVLCARRVEASADTGEKRGGVFAPSGACFLLVSFLCTSKEKKPARGAGTVIKFLRSRAQRAIPFKAWIPAFAGMTIAKIYFPPHPTPLPQKERELLILDSGFRRDDSRPSSQHLINRPVRQLIHPLILLVPAMPLDPLPVNAVLVRRDLEALP